MKMMDGGYNNFNNYYNNETVEEEEDDEQLTQKKSNHLPIWGNEKTMNLNTLVLTNIQSSQYFKVKLYALKTYHEVLDEIYYQVSHLEPWEKGSRKTAGQTGMCGGVRGVGAGGIVSTAFCILYKLFTLRLTRKQINGLINHADSPYIRGLGFMYIRYTQPPADLWSWLEPYMDDEEEVDVRAGGGQIITIGTMARHLLTKLDWHSTLFPRIPVPIQKDIEKRIQARDSAAAEEAMRERLQQQRGADDFRKKEEDGRNSAASNSRGASRDRRDRPPVDAVRDGDRGSRCRDRVSKENDRPRGRSNGRDPSSRDIDRRSSDNNRNGRDTDCRSRDVGRRSKDIDRRSKNVDCRTRDLDRRSRDVDHRIKDSSRRSKDRDRRRSRDHDRYNSRNRDRNNSRDRDRDSSRDRDRRNSRDRERHNSRDRDRRSSRNRDRSTKESNRRASRDRDRNHRDINRRSSRDRDRREKDREDQHVSKHKRGRHDDDVGNGRRRRDGSRSPRDFSADLQREQERIRTRLRSSSRSRSADRDRRHRR